DTGLRGRSAPRPVARGDRCDRHPVSHGRSFHFRRKGRTGSARRFAGIPAVRQTLRARIHADRRRGMLPSIRTRPKMNTESRIVIRAPRQTIFDTTSDLSRWPSILPHYRSIKYLERGNDRHVVKMAAHRDGIPVSWVSEQIIDRDAMEIHFHHLRAFTKGMDVVWSF